MTRPWMMAALIFTLTATLAAETIGPLEQAVEDTQYAVFTINRPGVRAGDQVVVQRGSKQLTTGQVTRVQGNRCLVQYKKKLNLYRGDILVLKKKSGRDLLGGGMGLPVVRRSSNTAPAKKRRARRSSHVLTPKQLATQSRKGSTFTMGSVMSVKSLAQQSRRNSAFTLGRTLTVTEYVQQMNR